MHSHLTWESLGFWVLLVKKPELDFYAYPCRHAEMNRFGDDDDASVWTRMMGD